MITEIIIIKKKINGTEEIIPAQRTYYLSLIGKNMDMSINVKTNDIQKKINVRYPDSEAE